MKMTYDREANAIYLYLTSTKIAHTQPINENVNLDIDAEGRVVGIELLRVGSWINEPEQIELRGILEKVEKP